MKVLMINGSPRRMGNTSKVLGWLADELEAGGHGVELLSLCTIDIKGGCVECFKCQMPGAGYECAQKDGLNQVFASMIAADHLVMASPLFAWSFSAQYKQLIDRGVCLVKDQDNGTRKSALASKPVSLVVTCGGPAEDNADLIQVQFQRLCTWMEADAKGALVVPGCHSIEGCPPEAQSLAREFAATLTQ